MLVLVIPKTDTYVPFVFNLRLHIIPGVIVQGSFSNKYSFSMKVSRNPRNFGFPV